MQRRNVHKQLLVPLQRYASACELYLHKQNNAARHNLRNRTEDLLCGYIMCNEQVIVDLSLRVGIYA